MRYTFSFLLIFFFASLKISAQDFEVLGGYSAESLVDIITAENLQTTNAEATGHPNSRGYFTGYSNLELSGGALLSSGHAFDAEGPNNSPNKGLVLNEPGDPDLEIIANYATQDASLLEFDFNPGEDTLIYFSFSLGSEEYPEFVGSSFNDAIGIFVSGPGISGPFSNDAINMARLPDTMPPVYVGINTVNQQINSAYYVFNEEDYLQYDAFTVRIVSSLEVMPNEDYHVKIAVADAGDGYYDSGFFIEKNGIGTQPLHVSPLITHNSCHGDSSGKILLNVEGFFPPYSIEWSTGDTTTVVDSLTAGNYWYSLTDSKMHSMSDTIVLTQPDSMVIDYQFTYHQNPCETEVTAIVAGGTNPYTYLWSDTAQQSGQTAILCPGTYGLTVTDSIDCIAIDSVMVTTGAAGELQVSFLGDTVELVNQICPDGISFSNVQYNGSIYASGSFEGLSNLGFNKGILLSTGNAWHAEGPNENYASGAFQGLPGDPDLEQISSQATHDAAVLEFDFVPETDAVDFYLVFASEEYDELVDEDFSDLTGFFVSGPGINGPYLNGAENFAVLPGTQEHIAANTVNNGYAAPGDMPGGPCNNCEFYIHNGEQSLGYDGFTSVQNVHLNVQPGASYHCKIAIADAGERDYDSGVFIKSSDGYFTGETPPKAAQGNFRAYTQNGFIYIIPADQHLGYHFSLYDVLGRKEISGEARGKSQLHASELSKGVKILQLQMMGKTAQIKLMLE